MFKLISNQTNENLNTVAFFFYTPTMVEKKNAYFLKMEIFRANG